MFAPPNKPHTAFWIFGIFCLIWNLMGVAAFISQVTMSPEVLASLPQEQRELYENAPMWNTVAFAIAVFGGALGCFALLSKKAFSFYILIFSLLGILVQMSYNFFISNAMDVYGPGEMAMPIMVLVIGIVLVWFAKFSENKGWIA